MLYIKFELNQQENKVLAGFTLIETLLVIAIIIIMGGISVPYFRGYISSERLQEVAWQMVLDLRMVKEKAIIYQQDLNVYFNFDSSKTIENGEVEPFSSTNLDNRSYFFETFQWGKDQVSEVENAHYIPTDSVNKHFVSRILKYGIVIDSITTTSSSSSIPFGGKNYFTICFNSGAGDTFRGETDIVEGMVGRENTIQSIINNQLLIKLRDSSTNKYFYVIVNGVGNITMNGSPPP
ncbi:MAG: hypothetical protein K6343_05130 [Caldisericaceae bacterium]